MVDIWKEPTVANAAFLVVWGGLLNRITFWCHALSYEVVHYGLVIQDYELWRRVAVPVMESGNSCRWLHRNDGRETDGVAPRDRASASGACKPQGAVLPCSVCQLETSQTRNLTINTDAYMEIAALMGTKMYHAKTWAARVVQANVAA